MNIKKLSIIGIIVGLILVISSSLFLILNKQEYVEESSIEDTIEYANINDLDIEEPQVKENIEEEKEEEPEESVIRESGWIPNWGFDLGFESLENNKGIIDTVNPVLYTVDTLGNVSSRGVSNEKIVSLLDYCKENNIRVIPTVGSFDFEAMRAAFSSTESYRDHLNTIVFEVERYDFDGIDLDYEMINVSEKEIFFDFLRDLKVELEHRDKILSLTIFPQWENATYTDHQETRGVQDYSLIGDIVDEVRIMAYDYTLQSSKEPGPIGPTNWIREVLDYAIKHIPREKIWLGIHLYGYQWFESRTIAFTYTTAQTIINNPNIDITYMDDIGESYSEFSCEGGFMCKAYFQDERGVQVRKEIAKEYGIAGVSYWRLGGELDILK
jgi:spore germination protein